MRRLLLDRARTARDEACSLPLAAAVKCANGTPRRATASERLVALVEEADAADKLALLRLATHYTHRVAKSSRGGGQAVPQAGAQEVRAALQRLLDELQWRPVTSQTAVAPAECGSRSRKPQAARPPPPPPPPRCAARGQVTAILPLDYAKSRADGRPAPPRRWRRPPGRARPREQLAIIVCEYLDARALVALGATCAGLAAFLRAPEQQEAVWGALAARQLAVRGVRDMRGLVAAWARRRCAPLVLQGADAGALETLLRQDAAVGDFNILFVRDCVPADATAQVSVGQALFCAAKTYSPCVVCILGPVAPVTPTATPPKLTPERYSPGRPITTLDVRHLEWLVRQDLSSDPVVVIHGLLPGQDRPPQYSSVVTIPECGPTEACAVEALLRRLAPGLDADARIDIARTLAPLGQEALATVLRRATSRAVTRVAQSTHFRLQDGKYRPCSETSAGAERLSLSDLPMERVAYGPLEAADLLAGLELNETEYE